MTSVIPVDTVYPITVRSWIYNHKGGTKFYAAQMLENALGHALVVFRWGKVGKFGDVMSSMCGSAVEAEKMIDKKLAEKQKGGYQMQHGSSSTGIAADASELPRVMSVGILNKVGPDRIKHLDPEFDTTGMRAVESPTFDEDGSFRPSETAETRRLAADAELREGVARQKAAQKILDDAASAATYANNPNFGRF